ncbi:hypothetical protein [Maritalea sp.]
MGSYLLREYAQTFISADIVLNAVIQPDMAKRINIFAAQREHA